MYMYHFYTRQDKVKEWEEAVDWFSVIVMTDNHYKVMDYYEHRDQFWEVLRTSI